MKFEFYTQKPSNKPLSRFSTTQKFNGATMLTAFKCVQLSDTWANGCRTLIHFKIAEAGDVWLHEEHCVFVRTRHNKHREQDIPTEVIYYAHRYYWLHCL